MLSHQLTATLETPSEAIQRIGWAEVKFYITHHYRKTHDLFAQPAQFAAIRFAIELNISEILERAGDAAVNVSQIASSTGADSPLIGEPAASFPASF